jgi:cysteinyl-tRNA synthetase
MGLRLFNTRTRKKELFKPAEQGVVRLYTCGPTVYNYAHIGNFRTFVFQDLLRRWLRYKGYKVVQVMNITDVDEKTVEWARRRKIPWRTLARKYEEAFFEDLRALNIEPAEHYPRTSEHIREIEALTQELLRKGYAFKDEAGNVYLNVHKVDYGRLSGRKPKPKLRARSKREDYEDPKHFALWKAWDERDADMYWESGHGKGRPGWHVECAALALHYLGDTVDIHSGGVDLIFPHHENSLAVCEAATGKNPAGYWLHVEHLIADGKKMSKSLGNFYTLRDLMKKGHDPRAVRLLLLSTHYREKLDFTLAALRDAEQGLSRLRGFMGKIKEVKDGSSGEVSRLIEEVKEKFEAALDDDLNSGVAVQALFEFMEKVEKEIDRRGISEEEGKRVRDVMRELDDVLALLEG